MAIDYGKVRTGLAVTDPVRIIATALTTVETPSLLPYIKDYCAREEVDIFVVGEAKHMDNTPSESMKLIEPFVAALREAFPNKEIARIDERFTSKMAFQTMIDSGLHAARLHEGDWKIKNLKKTLKKMILPIVGYGHPVLRKVAQPIDKDYPNLKELVANMYETMYAADGVGLAAPQVDLSIRVVVIGFRPYDEKTDTYGEATEEHTLINPEILSFGEKKDWFNEGCLSVPDIHEDVLRPTSLRLRWYDEDWNLHEEEIDGLFARVTQHEVDHLDGKVFTDHLSNLRRTMLKRRLNDIAAGRVRTRYRMKSNHK